MNILTRIFHKLIKRERRKDINADDIADVYSEAYPELSQEERDLLETQEIEEDD
jgi:hypothetical protein